MEPLFDRAAKLSRTQVTKMRWALGLHGLASAAVGVMYRSYSMASGPQAIELRHLLRRPRP